MRQSSVRRSAGGEHAPRDHYGEITNQIIAALEAGTPPWRRPWDPNRSGGPMMPQNAVTGARYRGINVLALGMSSLAFASGDPRWATYKQAADRGWQVKKGSRGTTALFFKRVAVRDTKAEPADGDEDETKRIPLLRAFTLFHASQIDGVPDFAPPSLEEAPWRASEASEIIVANSGAVVRIGGERAFYSPSTDHIQMPSQAAFETSERWSSTILHELSHWSGSPTRLNRDLRNRFGSHDYAREELRAEIAQVMICAELGIAQCEFSNGVAYIADWLETLRSDRKEVFRAAADAQRIADYLLAFHPAYAARAGESCASQPSDSDIPAEHRHRNGGGSVMSTTSTLACHDADYIARALATDGGHLSIGRGGGTLYFGGGCRLSGFNDEAMKEACIAAGLPDIDSRCVEWDAVYQLAVHGPMVAVGEPVSPQPWHSLSYEPLRHVADRYRAAGAEVYNLPPCDGEAMP